MPRADYRLRGAAFGALALISAGATARAQTAHHKTAARHAVASSAANDGLAAQVRMLSAKVEALQARLDAQSATQADDQAKLQQATDAAQSAAAQDADGTAAVLASIPGQVQSALDAARPKTDAFYYKGLKITPDGFIEAASVYRSRALGSDMFSPFNTIPFANSHTAHEDELRFSARQTRLSALVQGNINADTAVAFYSEFDFLGAAQSANYTESNSFQPRIRNLYATIDWENEGWRLLGGQTWTLATLNSKGITPRNEVIPGMIDPQFVPGFVWARQAQFRVTKDFSKKLWLALSVENAQTTFTGTAPANVVDSTSDSTGLYAGAANGSAPVTAGGPTTAVTPTTTTSSLNHLPDVIAKAAYETDVYGRSIHAEVFGLGRAFSERIGTDSNTVYGGGVGWGLVVPVLPDRLDVETSGLSGKGIGRYGTSQLPDVTFSPDGRIQPIAETDWLAGATLHATKTLSFYALGGEEHEDRRTYDATYGYGSPLMNLNGCQTEGGSCSAVTKFVEQGTIGFWDKFYQGPFGALQFGVQYSYTERHAFSGLGGAAPVTNDNIVFTSLRYYPF